jgi:hypothetical protein
VQPVEVVGLLGIVYETVSCWLLPPGRATEMVKLTGPGWLTTKVPAVFEFVLKRIESVFRCAGVAAGNVPEAEQS